MTGMSLPKNEIYNILGLGVIFKKAAGKYFKTSSCGVVLLKEIFSFLLLQWSETLSKMCFAKNFTHKLKLEYIVTMIT